MAIIVQLLALAYFVFLVFVIICALMLFMRLVTAHERVAKAMERIAFKMEESGSNKEG